MHILFSLSRRHKKQSLKRHGDLKTDGQLDSTPHQPYIFPYSFIFLKRTKSLGCFRKSITLCSIKIFGLCPLASGVFGTKRSLFLESLEIIQIGLSAACLRTLSKNAMITADSPVTCEIYDKLENHLVSGTDQIYKSIPHCLDIDLYFSVQHDTVSKTKIGHAGALFVKFLVRVILCDIVLKMDISLLMVLIPWWSILKICFIKETSISIRQGYVSGLTLLKKKCFFRRASQQSKVQEMLHSAVSVECFIPICLAKNSFLEILASVFTFCIQKFLLSVKYVCNFKIC